MTRRARCATCVGSSPLARGTHRLVSRLRAHLGLIPARAGNTASSGAGGAALRAHPRSRGEHLGDKEVAPLHLGLSPLARGTLSDLMEKPAWTGLIPARAGNTHRRMRGATRLWAHPRSRGEHHYKRHMALFPVGSSPLARGTPLTLWALCQNLGLIPARAGNTLISRGPCRCRRAHPRSRGEHCHVMPAAVRQKGSSPLARGTRYISWAGPRRYGLIPARAGNTAARLVSWADPGAHPRSRGEHQKYHSLLSDYMGSSPLARGTLSAFDLSDRASGLIPARAGNTGCPGADSLGWWAHPRSRGEHLCLCPVLLL